MCKMGFWGDFSLCCYCVQLLTVAFVRYCFIVCVCIHPSSCLSGVMEYTRSLSMPARWVLCYPGLGCPVAFCPSRILLGEGGLLTLHVFGGSHAGVGSVSNTCRKIVSMLWGESRGVVNRAVLCAQLRFYLRAPDTVGFF